MQLSVTFFAVALQRKIANGIKWQLSEKHVHYVIDLHRHSDQNNYSLTAIKNGLDMRVLNINNSIIMQMYEVNNNKWS